MARGVVKTPAAEVPQRFQTAKSTLFIDRLMTYCITVGGLAVILAVLGIFVFIFSQIYPLFRGAQVHEAQSVQLPPASYAILAADEWGEYPLLITTDGTLFSVDLVGNRGLQQVSLDLGVETPLSAFQYNQRRQDVTFATTDGRFVIVNLDYRTRFGDNNERTVTAAPQVGPLLSLGRSGFPITRLDYGDSGTNKLAAGIQKVEDTLEVHAVTLTQKRSLLGAGKTELGKAYDLTPLVQGEPQDLAVNEQADSVVVSTQAGDVYYFFREGNAITLRQVFTPFKDVPERTIASMHYLLGGVSLVFSNRRGDNRIFSLYRPEGSTVRLFGQTKTFPSLPGSGDFYAASLRNKAFLIGSGALASLRYATTETIRWQQELPFTVSQALLGGKYDRMLFLDTNHKLHVYALEDHHPEAGFKALFGKIWYEGASEPRYVWQSTGGTDDFEPKLSLVPIIIGTLKGTLYAMLFAVPIALLAAVYTSQFSTRTCVS
jgi:phosphate transport system permease protein